MMEPSLALQAAIRGKLIGSAALTALVPAVNIIDRNGQPAVFPCILIGEGQTVPGGDIERRMHEVFCDLHVWVKEVGLVTAKQITAAVRAALVDGVGSVSGLHVADLHVASSRFMRDPGGVHSHAVLTLAAKVKEVGP